MHFGTGARRRVRKAGFTMAEALVTLGIVAILLAVAAPGVMNLQHRLKMNELDACARQIFIAAQNTLTGAQGAGRFEALQAAGEPGGGDNVYVTQSSAALDVVLPGGAIDPAVAAQHYLILYNPQTATVIEVYYAEHGFTPPDAFALRGAENQKARSEAVLGYYDGTDVAREPVEQLPAPQLDIIDDNVSLRVVASVPVKYHIGTQLTVTLQNAADETESKTVVVPLKADGTGELMLDSLYGERFIDTVSEWDSANMRYRLPPGCDLLISAQLAYLGSDKLSIPGISSRSAAVNSLYASRTQTEDGTTIVEIATARHLQNLDEAYASLSESNVTSLRAVQSGPIDWPSELAFQPIQSTEYLTGYDGQRLPIRGLRPADNGAKGVGMFGTILHPDTNRIVLQGIRLEDSYVQGGSAFFVGTLAGQLDNCDVTDCLVYAKNDLKNSGVFSSNLAASSGGLIGKTINCKLSFSGVGLPRLESPNAGGLVGTANSTSIRSSYAVADLLSSSNSAAMFLGQGSGNHVEDCYAVGTMQVNLENGGVYSGFSNAVAGVLRSYCAVSYVDEKQQPTVTADALGVNGFAPENAVYGTQESCMYLLPASLPAWNNGNSTGLSYAELTEWTGGPAWTALPRSASNPYAEDLTGKAYPFPGLLQGAQRPLPHYGSWPQAPKTAEGVRLAYVETYKNAPAGVYTLEPDGKIINTLQTGDVLQSVSYGLLLPEGYDFGGLFATSGQVQMNGQSLLRTDFRETSALPVMLGEQHFTFYPAMHPFANRIQDYTTRSVSFVIASDTYWFHPGFGASIARESQKELLGTESLPYQIRVPMHLKRLSDSPDLGETLFLQTRDIFFYDGDEWQPSAHSLGVQQIFDGNRFRIVGLPNSLFSSMGPGTAQNVILEQAYVMQARDTGIFAYASTGTIDNCHIINSEISGTGSLAGFVYTVSGPIRNSSFYAQSAYEDAVVRSDAYAAGFVYSSSTTIENCYVAATITGSTASGFVGLSSGLLQRCYSNNMVTGSSSASGFAETISGWGATDCFALGTVTSSTLAGGFSASFCPQSVTRCYAAAKVQPPLNVTAFGFSQPYLTLEQCYYLNDASQLSGAGTAINMDGLTTLDLGAVWTLGTIDAHPFSKNLSAPYPYPMIEGLPLYGDWPVQAQFPADSGGLLGVFHYTVQNGMLYIDAAYALDCLQLENPKLSGQLLPDTVVIPLPPNWNAPDSGLGLFWSQGFFENTDYNQNSNHGITIKAESVNDKEKDDEFHFKESKLNPLFDIGSYHFYPFPIQSDEVEIKYKHDNSGSKEWEYEFKYEDETWEVKRDD